MIITHLKTKTSNTADEKERKLLPPIWSSDRPHDLSIHFTNHLYYKKRERNKKQKNKNHPVSFLEK